MEVKFPLELVSPVKRVHVGVAFGDVVVHGERSQPPAAFGAVSSTLLLGPLVRRKSLRPTESSCCSNPEATCWYRPDRGVGRCVVLTPAGEAPESKWRRDDCPGIDVLVALTLGMNPTCWVSFVRVNGSQLSDPLGHWHRHHRPG